MVEPAVRLNAPTLERSNACRYPAYAALLSMVCLRIERTRLHSISKNKVNDHVGPNNGVIYVFARAAAQRPCPEQLKRLPCRFVIGPTIVWEPIVSMPPPFFCAKVGWHADDRQHLAVQHRHNAPPRHTDAGSIAPQSNAPSDDTLVIIDLDRSSTAIRRGRDERATRRSAASDV